MIPSDRIFATQVSFTPPYNIPCLSFDEDFKALGLTVIG